MANNSKRYTREFSYARPIMYQGEAYPSADSMISDEYGNKIKGTIFADTFGNYYTKDRSNNVFPVMPVENLDEITVTAPRKQNALADAFSRYLTMSNDITQVSNLPHREYNTHLKANAERGAREHALWDKENPNLSAWRDAATAVPLAVAATPIVLGAGQGILGTTAGQVARQGIAALMENPIVGGINDALGVGFATKGSFDMSQGKFTPETALDLAGGTGLMYRGLTTLENTLRARRAARNLTATEPTILGVEDVDLGLIPSRINETPRPVGRENEFQGLFGRSMAEDNARASQAARENNVPVRLLDGNNQNIEVQNTTSIPWSTRHPEDIVPSDFGTTPFQEGNPLDDIVVGSDWEDVDLFSDNPSNNTFFMVRNLQKGDAPYTDEEVNALVDDNGFLKDGITFENRVNTGSHGNFYHSGKGFYREDSPTEVLQKYLTLKDPNNPRNSAWETARIKAANPRGRSGILLDTHSGDTSMDSTPLAYSMATTLGKKFKPLEGAIDTHRYNIPMEYRQDFKDRGRILSNDFGYSKAFKSTDELDNRARALFNKNPNYRATLLRDKEGNMIAYELTDENGTFQIPLNSRQEVLNIMNKRLHNFNKYFNTSYQDITPFMNKNGNIFNPDNPYPWYFGEQWDIPNIYGILYKKGGKLKRRLLTDF